ncbi:hypothetical protein [Xanthomarina sp. GH4-25]|uniref:hypothetical protein n=1 Tax=Xanthomarina sp. GH4-25 TaxID=3349335 RepID=UPI0038782703
MKSFILLITFFSVFIVKAQENMEQTLPFYELPDYPETYTAGTVAGRMVESLGFRYYWATESLTEADLNYKPSENARSTSETINHIYSLSLVIVNSTLKKPNTKSVVEMTFEEKRIQTLLNLEIAANILKASDDISQYKIIGDKEIPFWNEINGPIADAIWHCGQIASFRRSSGNPINSKVDHFNGKVKS